MPLLVYSTRGTGDWHVYTAIFDTRRSEIFVDGCCEATGKNVGNNVLDGLSIGCDHNGIFFLNGSLAEIRLYHCHLPTAQRVQTEVRICPHTHSLSKAFSAPCVAPSLLQHSLANDFHVNTESTASPNTRWVVMLSVSRRHNAGCARRTLRS